MYIWSNFKVFDSSKCCVLILGRSEYMKTAGCLCVQHFSSFAAIFAAGDVSLCQVGAPTLQPIIALAAHVWNAMMMVVLTNPVRAAFRSATDCQLT
jgi:hypothetical protein